MTRVWIIVNPIPNLKWQGSRLLWAGWKVIIMEVNTTMNHDTDRWFQRWKWETILIFRYERLDAQGINFWQKIYLFMIWIMIIFDIYCVYFLHESWLSLLLLLFMWCIVFLLITQEIILNREKTVRSQIIAKMIKVLLSGDMCYEDNLSEDAS